jgi:hypothetical protein
MRILGIIVIILGLVGILFGIMFFPQASSGENEIVAAIAPLTLDQVNGKYDEASAKYDALKAAEEPKIQAKTAAPSISYVYVAAQRALLGLAKSNIGTVSLVRYLGIVNIAVGLGLAVTGFVFLRKSYKKAK